jgi:hypothetical protein
VCSATVDDDDESWGLDFDLMQDNLWLFIISILPPSVAHAAVAIDELEKKFKIRLCPGIMQTQNYFQ